MREAGSGRLVKKTNVGSYSIRILRLNREGLVGLRRRRKVMRAMLRRELRRLLSVLEQTKRKKHRPSDEVLARLTQVQQTLQTRPILSLLPDWWNP
jgi:hypothetical protein